MSDPAASPQSDIPPGVGVDGARMALGNTAEIAKDPTRGIDREASAGYYRDEPAPDSGSSTLELIKASGMPGDVVADALRSFESGDTQSAEELAAIDAASLVETRAELRSLWGDKYADNIGRINKLLDGFSAGAAIRDARTSDGRALMNDPATLQRLLGLAQKPRPNIANTDSVEKQIKKIESFLKRDRAAYFRDESIQAKYRELVAQRDAG